MEVKIQVGAAPRNFLELGIPIQCAAAIENSPHGQLLAHIGDENETCLFGVLNAAYGLLRYNCVLIALFQPHIASKLNFDPGAFCFQNSRTDLECGNSADSVFKLGWNAVDCRHDRVVLIYLVTSGCIDGFDRNDGAACGIDEGDACRNVAVPASCLGIPVDRKIRHHRHNDNERTSEPLKFSFGEKSLAKLIFFRKHKICLLGLP